VQKYSASKAYIRDDEDVNVRKGIASNTGRQTSKFGSGYRDNYDIYSPVAYMLRFAEDK
jgi:hypothetical protein